MTQAAAFARPELLVETDWLAGRLDDPSIVIVDCDIVEAYQRAHLPNAICLTHPILPEPKRYLKDPDNPTFILPPDKFGKVMGDLGVGDDSLVIAYDASRSLYAARLWWCLNYYGHEQVKVLNGGWRKWISEKRPISDVQRQPQGGATFTPRANPSLLATAEYLMAGIQTGELALLDVRSDGEWTGETTRGNKRSGHMPNAAHLEWVNYIDPETHTFKPPEALNDMLSQAGITPEKETSTYCQGGIRAALGMFTLRLLGFDKVRNYDGSFGEWGNRDDTPIVKEP
jgi:thiosulfate/3-mercaptopyruvate sulfurtransferase